MSSRVLKPKELLPYLASYLTRFESVTEEQFADKKDPEMLQYMEKKLGGGKVLSQKQFLDLAKITMWAGAIATVSAQSASAAQGRRR